MKKSIGYILFFTLSCTLSSFAQSADKDFEQIKASLFQQQKDWNSGNIDAFMTAYWQDEQLQFGGSQGITRGWQQTLDRYKKGYPDKATMGQLEFEVKDITRHSKKVISLTGSWALEREKDKPNGHFLLVWRKIKGQWRIVIDHTSSNP